MQKRVYLVLAALTALAISIQVAAYYYSQQSRIAISTSNLVAVNTLINYGNGTLRWYNETVPSGWNSYQLTLNVTKGNLEADVYPPPLNEHLVRAINGVTNNGTFSWWLWTFCQATNAWMSSSVGADLIQMSTTRTIAWAFATSTKLPPIPGAKIVGNCSGSS